MMNLWFDLEAIVESISFHEKVIPCVGNMNLEVLTLSNLDMPYFPIEALYTPVYTLPVWKICIPTRVRIFLWLVGNNRLLTRDNLAKRRLVNDMSSLFCSEVEIIHHIFFDCCVASNILEVISHVCTVILEQTMNLW